MLEVHDLNTFYGESHILRGLSLRIGEGETVSLLGRNGAGKTTTIRSIIGLTPPASGRVIFQDKEITGLPPYELYRQGIKWVPQERRIFPTLTVQENLRLAMIHSPRSSSSLTIETIYERFPILDERRNQKGGLLSGGEKQMLAIARALLGTTKLILLDEPSEGLAPLIIQNIQQMIRDMRRNVSILLAEQNVALTLEVAQRHYIIERGVVQFEGSSAELRANQDVLERHLGVTLSN